MRGVMRLSTTWFCWKNSCGGDERQGNAVLGEKHVGEISEHVRRRATMLMGLCASLAGTVLFAVAPDFLWLFLARTLMGVGVALSAGPSTAAVVEFAATAAARNSSRRAALITTVAQAAGFAAALLLGGALIAFAPLPTRLSFWVLAMLLTLLLVATWFQPRHTTAGMATVWRPRLPFVPSKTRESFATASVAMMTAYTHGVLILSLVWPGRPRPHQVT